MDAKAFLSDIRQKKITLKLKKRELEETKSNIEALRAILRKSKNAEKKNAAQAQLIDQVEYRDALILEISEINSEVKKASELIEKLDSHLVKNVLRMYYLSAELPLLNDVAKELYITPEYAKKLKRMGLSALSQLS